MKLSAIAVGALIREQITEMQVVEPIPIPKNMIHKQEVREKIYTDARDISFQVGKLYHDKEVYGVVKCTVNPGKEASRYRDGYYYPINKKGMILREDGGVGGLAWDKFKNNYKMTLIEDNLTPKLKNEVQTEAQIEAAAFKYTGDDLEKRNNVIARTIGRTYDGIIGETVMHCRKKKNITVIKNRTGLYNELRRSPFWKELDRPGDKTHRFDNTTMGSTIWKYKEKWIISSHSAYLSLINKKD